MPDLMIDLETLGTSSDCVILTLGAVKFSPLTSAEPSDALYIRFDVDQQVSMGRIIDEGTITWWGKQDEAVREEALGDEDRTDIETACNQLNKFLVGVDSIWAQGPVFDIAILEHLYASLNRPRPWHYWQIRDSRTLFSLVKSDPRKPFQVDLHNALADAVTQAKAVQSVFKSLNITS